MIAGDLPFDPDPGVRRSAAPEFPEALRWVNCRERPRLRAWAGRVLVVVFWNASSASSTNLLASLQRLEKRRPGAFAMVCVHTPRYPSQQADAVVRKAARRMGLAAPLANDAEWQAWQQFGVRAWPTTLVIDGAGGLAARFAGEHCGRGIEDAIAQLTDGMHPLAAPAAPVVELIDARAAATPLAFPTHALATDQRLYVSDAGHHRVLECAHDGRVLRQFGSGAPGNWDGQAAACGLQFPHGLATADGGLYIADTGNHSVRRVRLETGDVETLLGTGLAARVGVEQQGGGARIALNAPQAVACDGNALYVAVTGQHQIVRVDLRRQQVQTIAGDGRVGARDGIGAQCSLAQPTALALLPGQLLFADAGNNAVRRLRLADLAVTTLAGGAAWQPGRRDGSGRAARFAYPCGLAVAGERAYVADTCNERLCALDPYSGEVTTIATDASLQQPVGLSYAAGSLWLADRDAHAVLRIDPVQGTCERVPVDE